MWFAFLGLAFLVAGHQVRAPETRPAEVEVLVNGSRPEELLESRIRLGPLVQNESKLDAFGYAKHPKNALDWQDLRRIVKGRKCSNEKADEQCGDLVCRKGLCSFCTEDSECPSLHQCVGSRSEGWRCRAMERKAWESAWFDRSEKFCTFLILVSSALAAASGTGGGSIFVPVLISFSYLQESAVVALSQFMILVGSIVNLSVLIARRHPDFPELPVIDYDCIVVLIPMLCLGVTLGVLVNRSAPSWLLLLLLCSTLCLALWRTGTKGLKQLKKEQEQLDHRVHEEADDARSFRLLRQSADDEMTMKSTVGTLLYCSPDVISGKAYTSKCDLWSLGVIVFMLLSGRPPFITSMGHERMRKDISRAKVQWDRLENVSAEARDFVHKLLVLDPLQRLDAAAALNHPWLASKDVTQDWDRARAGGHRIKGVLSALKQYMQQSKLHRLLLQLLAQELGNEEAKEMRELFLQIDSDERGTIRLGDLKAAMARRRAPGSPKGMMDMVVGRRLTSPNLSPTNQIPEEQVEQIFSMLDANGDEEVHYSDFLAATVNMRGRWRREALRKIFNRIDRDASGTISVSEVQRVVAETVEDATTAEEFLKESKVTLNSKGEISFEAFADLFERKDLCITGSSPVTRKDMLKACAWDESPHSRRRRRQKRFTRSESEP